MTNVDGWNKQLIILKQQYPWLTNRVIADALYVSLDCVNAWTKTNGPAMRKSFYELLELKIKWGVITSNKMIPK